MKLYHPAYERKRDRVTGIDFVPEKLERRLVATATVTDPAHVASLRKRGWQPWPTEEGAPAPSSPASTPAREALDLPAGPALPTAAEVDAMTVLELRALLARLSIDAPAKAKKDELRALVRTPF